MALRWLLLGFATLSGAGACVEARGIDRPELGELTQSVLLLYASTGAAEEVMGWAYSREEFEVARLPPVVLDASGRPPTLWLDYVPDSLETLGLMPGPLSLRTQRRCGARELPVGGLRHQLRRIDGGFEFVAAPSDAAPPEVYIEGPCPCESAPEYRIFELDEFCRPRAVLTRDRRVLIAGQNAATCDEGSERTRTRREVDLSSGEVSTSSSAVLAASALSTDGVRVFFGDFSGGLHELRSDGRTSLLFRPPMPTGEVSGLAGGLANGELELMLAIEPMRENRDDDRTESEMLYRFRPDEGTATLVVPAEAAADATRQKLVLLWVDAFRTLLFPEDQAAWLDVRADAAPRYFWPSTSLARTGTVMPSGEAFVGTSAGTFLSLQRSGTEWIAAEGFSNESAGEAEAIAAIDDRQVWYFVGKRSLGRRIDGQACPEFLLPDQFDRAAFLVRGDDVVIVGERTDLVGTTLIALKAR